MARLTMPNRHQNKQLSIVIKIKKTLYELGFRVNIYFLGTIWTKNTECRTRNKKPW